MTKPIINGREVKVGDRLYSYLLAEWGEVIRIVDTDIYPIRMRFQSIGGISIRLMADILCHSAPKTSFGTRSRSRRRSRRKEW